VFYLGGTPSSSSRHPGGVNILLGDGSVRFSKDLDAIATELARMPARSVSTIMLGPSSQTGYVTTRWALSPDSKQAPSLGLTGAGGSAVMIGLLLPAVQAAREAARSKARWSVPIQTLKSLVGPAGHVFVIDSDNTLLPL
jgi:prepilin-type processing-associated H-X9-DG protein